MVIQATLFPSFSPRRCMSAGNKNHNVIAIYSLCTYLILVDLVLLALKGGILSSLTVGVLSNSSFFSESEIKA